MREREKQRRESEVGTERKVEGERQDKRCSKETRKRGRGKEKNDTETMTNRGQCG